MAADESVRDGSAIVDESVGGISIIGVDAWVSVDESEGGAWLVSPCGVKTGWSDGVAVEVKSGDDSVMVTDESMAGPDESIGGLAEFVGIDVKVLAPFTAKAIQLKVMSSGAGLLRRIVKPFVSFLITK